MTRTLYPYMIRLYAECHASNARPFIFYVTTGQKKTHKFQSRNTNAVSARKENYLLGVWGIIYHSYLGSTDRDLENKHEYDDKKSRMSETQSGGQYEKQCPNVENDSNKIRAQRRES